jgi:hypothetical protein
LDVQRDKGKEIKGGKTMTLDFVMGAVAGAMVATTVFFFAEQYIEEKYGTAWYEPPRPCNGPAYDDWTDYQWINKIQEEWDEVKEALAEYRANPCKATLYALMLECTDLITVMTSFQERMGVGAKKRAVYQGIVNKTNEIRDDGRRMR